MEVHLVDSATVRVSQPSGCDSYNSYSECMISIVEKITLAWQLTSTLFSVVCERAPDSDHHGDELRGPGQ